MLIRALPLLLFGCSGVGDAPWVEAHRGAAGYWPQNSRMAMYGAIAHDFQSIEFDVVLTADDVPVLAHDPWVHEALCTTQAGNRVGKRVEIRDLTLEALQAEYLCGGVPDPDFPNAIVRADSVMTFDELLVALKSSNPDLVVHVDVKYEPLLTAAPEAFAEAILGRWYAADLPNPYYVTANLGEALQAFEDYARAHNREITTSVAWPRFPPGESTTAVALAVERDLLLGKVDYVDIARDAGADGLAIYYEAADRHLIEVARAEGLQIQLWTLDTPELLAHYQRWPVDALITDYPGDL